MESWLCSSLGHSCFCTGTEGNRDLESNRRGEDAEGWCCIHRHHDVAHLLCFRSIHPVAVTFDEIED